MNMPRPKKCPTEKKLYNVSVRLTEEEYAKVKQHRNASKFLRSAVNIADKIITKGGGAQGNA